MLLLPDVILISIPRADSAAAMFRTRRASSELTLNNEFSDARSMFCSHFENTNNFHAGRRCTEPRLLFNSALKVCEKAAAASVIAL
jgi:hypothetical protein